MSSMRRRSQGEVEEDKGEESDKDEEEHEEAEEANVSPAPASVAHPPGVSGVTAKATPPAVLTASAADAPAPPP